MVHFKELFFVGVTFHLQNRTMPLFEQQCLYVVVCFSSSLLIFTYFSFEIKFVEKKMCFESTLHTLFVLSYRVTRRGLKHGQDRERETTFLTFTAASNEATMFNVGMGPFQNGRRTFSRLLARRMPFTKKEPIL